MEKTKLKKFAKTLAGLAVAVAIGIPLEFKYVFPYANQLHKEQHSVRLEKARAIAMQNYIPVGNGGALAEMNGRISPERRKMYDKIYDDILRYMKREEPMNYLDYETRDTVHKRFGPCDDR